MMGIRMMKKKTIPLKKKGAYINANACEMFLAFLPRGKFPLASTQFFTQKTQLLHKTDGF